MFLGTADQSDSPPGSLQSTNMKQTEHAETWADSAAFGGRPVPETSRPQAVAQSANAPRATAARARLTATHIRLQTLLSQSSPSIPPPPPLATFTRFQIFPSAAVALSTWGVIHAEGIFRTLMTMLMTLRWIIRPCPITCKCRDSRSRDTDSAPSTNHRLLGLSLRGFCKTGKGPGAITGDFLESGWPRSSRAPAPPKKESA